MNRRPEYTAKLFKGQSEQNVAQKMTADLVSVKLLLEIIAFVVKGVKVKVNVDLYSALSWTHL